MSDSFEHLAWTTRDRRTVSEHRIFRVEHKVARHPQTGHDVTFVVLDSRDWVNVIPVTSDDRIVLVRQYRHGTDEVSVEIPGGIVDPGEDSLQAGRRELLEETGYAADRWEEIGRVDPNPAFLNNRCRTFLALDAKVEAQPSTDSNEVIEVELRSFPEVKEMVRSGEISHSLVVSAFAHLLVRAGDWRRPT